MAEPKHPIDKLFNEQLAGHKVKAPVNAWYRLQRDLHKPARTRFFWYSRAAAALVLLLIAFGAGYFFSELNRNESPQLADKAMNLESKQDPVNVPAQDLDIQTAQKSETKAASLIDNNKTSPDPASEIKQARIQYAEITPEKNSSPPSDEKKLLALNLDDDHLNDPNQKQEIAEPLEAKTGDITEEINPIEIINSEEFVKTETSRENNKDSIAAAPLMDEETLHRLLIGEDAYASDIMPASKVVAASGWSIGGRVSPVYSYRTVGGSSFATANEKVSVDYFNDNEEGITSVAAGISLDYAFSDRLSLASGMYLSRIGQQNNEVLAYNDPDATNMYKLATSNGTVTINPVKFESVIAPQAVSAKDSLPGDYSVHGSFYQNLDYLEVPLVLKYRVLDQKFSVNVMGGLSPGILVNNRSYFDVDGQKLQTGTVENVESFIYNSIFGLGLEYAINRKLSINMEPSFKYAISPVNSGNGINYHPYSFSWFTGISYKLY